MRFQNNFGDRKPGVMMSSFEGYSLGLLHFLRELKTNNNRDWFQKNKHRYESELLEPSLQLIESMQKPLKSVSPHFQAIPKKVGGSLMRIYRDTRFAKDKSPYKTNVGIQFRHAAGGDVHAPGFYFHIEPESVFVGAGIWHPAADSLWKIRSAIAENGAKWKRAKNAKAFQEHFELAGDSLTRPPRSFDSDHPLIEDIKRKDFIGVHEMNANDLFERDLVKILVGNFKAAAALMRFLCDAINVPF